jgi:hypothetical protein
LSVTKKRTGEIIVFFYMMDVYRVPVAWIRASVRNQPRMARHSISRKAEAFF